MWVLAGWLMIYHCGAKRVTGARYVYLSMRAGEGDEANDEPFPQAPPYAARDRFSSMSVADFAILLISRSHTRNSTQTQHNMANTIAVEEDDWEGWEAEQTPVRCMFVDAIEQSVAAALARDKAATGFDLGAVRHAHKLGIYKTIRLINFVRAKVRCCAITGQSLESRGVRGRCYRAPNELSPARECCVSVVADAREPRLGGRQALCDARGEIGRAHV